MLPASSRWTSSADSAMARSNLPLASASSGQIGNSRSEGVDVSHRGGLPGFVQVIDDTDGTSLVIPDYQGNFFFNTLGNLLQWPLAGLLFVDPATGDMLQLAVTTMLQLEGPELAAFAGAQRLLLCRVTQGLWRESALPLLWSAPQYAPQFAA